MTNSKNKILFLCNINYHMFRHLNINFKKKKKKLAEGEVDFYWIKGSFFFF